jgi:hypothetical protein
MRKRQRTAWPGFTYESLLIIMNVLLRMNMLPVLIIVMDRYWAKQTTVKKFLPAYR